MLSSNHFIVDDAIKEHIAGEALKDVNAALLRANNPLGIQFHLRIQDLDHAFQVATDTEDAAEAISSLQSGYFYASPHWGATGNDTECLRIDLLPNEDGIGPVYDETILALILERTLDAARKTNPEGQRIIGEYWNTFPERAPADFAGNVKTALQWVGGAAIVAFLLRILGIWTP